MSRPRFKASPGVAVRQHPRGHLQYLAGPLRADLGMAMCLRAGGQVPPRLFAGLLARGADPDGGGYDEVLAAGYCRQAVDLFPFGGRLAVPHPVTFDASAPLLATHIAIFGSETGGDLLWSGALLGSRYERLPGSSVHLPSFMLTLAKPSTLDAVL